jgi:subtilisin family serine protease
MDPITAIVATAVISTYQIRVAVVDTGISSGVLAMGKMAGLCNDGHKDFTNTSIEDTHGHGTNVSGLIHAMAKDSNYCQVILKFFAVDDGKSLEREIAALEYAIEIGVDVINLSLGGSEPDPREKEVIERALNKGITIVTAAGNDGRSMGRVYEVCREVGLKYTCEKKPYYYYPAAYDSRIVVVGNIMSETSNSGLIVKEWENGVDIRGDYGYKLTGTSQAAAVRTGKIVRRMYESYRKVSADGRMPASH